MLDLAFGDPGRTSTGFFITDDGYLISNYHVVKDATKVRLLTSAGLIDAKVVQVDAANDLALLKANEECRMQNAETGQKQSPGNSDFILHNSSFNLRFTPLPIVPVARGFWAARWRRSVFPTSVCRGSKNTNDEGRMKNEETKPHPVRANWHFFIHPSSFFISPLRCRRM
jgi:hypothetical protein